MRARLLTPVIVLAVCAAAAVGAVEEFSVHKQAEDSIIQRGATVLEGISQRLQERRQINEEFVQLLAQFGNVAPTAEEGDVVGLAQELVPFKARLSLETIEVYDIRGKQSLRLGPDETETDLAPLIDTGLSGMTHSTVDVSGEGLVVMAATPIKGPRGIVGAIIVDSILGGDALKQVGDRDSVEMAVFRQGRLITTSITDAALLRLLSGYSFTPANLEKLDDIAHGFNFHIVGKGIGGEGLLVALVPMGDLVQATSRRSLMLLAITSVLVLALLTVGLMIARDIARPLEAMVRAARGLVMGNYRQEVPAGHIRELNELSGAFNQLGTQLDIQRKELEHQAFYDKLTNLPNRALFVDRLEHSLARTARQDHRVAVMLLDIDNFKYVNDTLGHSLGDQLLVDVARRVLHSTRGEDTVARLGGDELTILVDEATDANVVINIAERIQDQLRAPFMLGEQQVFITASIGIALSTLYHREADALLREADVAMYRAKSNGKARYEIFDETMNARVKERLELETDLRRAIENGEFRLHYQPVVLLKTRRINEVEALIRWEHPHRGLVSPAEFIPLAEETGLILPIGSWVLHEACREARLLQTRWPTEPPLTISVNLSARQFQSPSLIEEVASALHETGLDPCTLKLEITESVMMQDMEATIEKLDVLKDQGIRLAIDDFGTGYSSLAYLKRFPIDTLKIDRSLITGVGRDFRDTAIVRAAIMFAKALNLAVTAEGIETDEQLARLTEMSCDQGQGYYLSKPLPPEALADLIASHPGRPLTLHRRRR